MTTPDTRGVLLVLDGWGQAPPGPHNALSHADTPVLNGLREKHPSSLLDASGEAVGLLPGTVGNSEIGHLVIGAGRPLPYDSLLVQREIDSGRLREHPTYNEVCADLAIHDRALHLVGLCSDGQIHAHVGHLEELLAVAARRRVPRVWIHAVTDGRDVSDGTAATYLRQVEKLTAGSGTGRIATVVGRGYALDKAGNLELTERAGRLVADGEGALVDLPADAVAASDRGDEWVPPSVLTAPDGTPLGAIDDGDAVLFFNFRSDRIQQLADYLVTHLDGTSRAVRVLSLAQYDTRAPIEPLVRRADASGGLADALSDAGLRSVRIAEPEKFEHVTYYVNGRDKTSRSVEEHVRITGTAPDYVARPEMNVAAVADAVVSAARRDDVALVVANLANIDVVGHTGDFRATVRAAEHTDAAVARIVAGARESGRWVLLVGDHGNAEVMARTDGAGNARPYGGHTCNPVPVVLVPPPGRDGPSQLAGGGTLADVSPTVLALLGCLQPATMTGRALL